MARVFGTKSKAMLATVHPLLVEIMTEALQTCSTDFSVICGHRNREDQEKEFREGDSKVHYGNSAHNAEHPVTKQPRACAVDVLPYPFTNYKDPAMLPKWRAIFDAANAAAEKRKVQLRWGGGIPDKSFDWDKPHIELHPWRQYAAKP
jgi:peptidoglycan L-alanyl-D-glutamate endopeptidase CwlK